MTTLSDKDNFVNGRSSLQDCLTLEDGPDKLPEKKLAMNLRCVTTQKSEDFTYNTAKPEITEIMKFDTLFVLSLQ